MTDKINEKVIDIFAKNKKNPIICCDEKVCKCSDGYYYVCMKSDLNGKPFDEEKLVKYADESYYIVKILLKQGIVPYIHNYKIPGKDVLGFIELYINGNKEGKIIEIDKFYPEDWA